MIFNSNKTELKSCLIILTLNEIEAVKQLFKKIPFKIFDEYFVVDGGSSDGTIEFFRQRGIKVYLQDKPGHGEAYKFGVNKAKSEVIVFFSGDGNEIPEDIPKMLKEIKKGYDLVIASRFMKGAKTLDAGTGRRFGNRFFTFMVNFFWGGSVTDVFNAFRAVNKKAVEKLNLQSSFFDTELEMIAKALKQGYRIKEFPTLEIKRLGGEAKLQTWRDGFMNLDRLSKELGIDKLIRRYFPIAALFIIVFLGLVIRLPLMSVYPLDRDDLARVVPDFTFGSFIPPGPRLFYKIFGSFFGYTDFGYRFTALVFGTFGLVLIFFVGKAFFGTVEGLLASFIAATSLVHVAYSTQVKEYGLVMDFLMISSILVYKILFGKEGKKFLFSAYFLVSLLALFFSSYFYSLAIFYQIIIIITFFLLRNLNQVKSTVAKLIHSRKVFFLILLLGALSISSFILIWGAFDRYFGLRISLPQVSRFYDYFKKTTFFFTQNERYAVLIRLFFILGTLLSLFLAHFGKAFLYLLSFILLDGLLVSSIKFLHPAYPLHYPRYHSFLMPLYLVALVGFLGELIVLIRQLIEKIIFKLKLSKNLLFRAVPGYLAIITVVGLTVFFDLKFILNYKNKWSDNSSLGISKENFRGAGRYLTASLKPNDTIVRVKNFGMDHKFNHVHCCIDTAVLSQTSYSIFPDRTSKNNWYVPLLKGDEDTWGFNDWLVEEKIRPSLDLYEPYVLKFGYYGPLIRTRELKDKRGWKVSSSFGESNLRLAIDNNKETIWSGSVKTGDYLLLDLGRIYLLNSINFNFSENFPQNFIIWLSLDGKDWQSVFTLASPGYFPQNFGKIFFKPAQARFAKIEFAVDPLSFKKEIGIGEIEANEVYERNLGIKKEEIFNAEPIVKFHFLNNFEGWNVLTGIVNLKIKESSLDGLVTNGETARLKRYLDNRSLNGSSVNFINFSLRADKGAVAEVGLEADKEIFWFKNIKIESDNLFHYYSLNLDSLGFPKNLRNKITGIIFKPSDASGARFSLDFLSLDKQNLPGIQVKDDESPNGFSQFIPYDPDDDYIFYQIGDRLSLEKGNYLVNFKIKADLINPLWKEETKPEPSYRFYQYLMTYKATESDILFFSIESTKGTFYESPASLNIQGETFIEANKYYEFSVPFKADGKEKLFFQIFSPRNRRYPANLLITYPEITRLK